MEYAVNNQKTFKTNKFLEYFTGKKSVDVTDKNFENASCPCMATPIAEEE